MGQNQAYSDRIFPVTLTRIDIPVGPQTIRMAYGFSFDVGNPSTTELDNGGTRVNDDAVRMLYTTRDAESQRIYVRGSSCRADLSVCKDVPQWGTTPGNLNTPRNQWNPTVKAWIGFIGLPPVWKATYQTTDDDPNAVSIKQGNLAVAPVTRSYAIRGWDSICMLGNGSAIFTNEARPSGLAHTSM